ncbi:MAG TPA: beta-ketoacyl-ACP synthase [Leptolyngbyaceae cyanobacterium]
MGSAALEVVVTGVGLISALGPDAQSNWANLLQGKTAISLRQPFPELPVLPLAMIGKHSATLHVLLNQAVDEALEDAQLPQCLPNCGVVIGSSRSYQALWEDVAASYHHQRQISPEVDWLNMMPHMMAVATAQRVGSTGPVLTPMAACATGLWTLFQGSELIRQGVCDRVIAGAVETPITPLTLAGFQRMGALANRGCYPFDRQREGLVVGEGAAVMVLEAAHTARQRGVRNYGRILGFGLTADGHHVSAPDPTHKSSHLALQACLERAQLQPSDVSYIHAHGTSTQLNDAHEAALIQQVFPPSVAVSSSKGATGHTLGASGSIGAIFCLLSLQQQILPPSVGLSDSAFAVNFVRQAIYRPVDVALCFSFGFGGQNAVLALGRSV